MLTNIPNNQTADTIEADGDQRQTGVVWTVVASGKQKKVIESCFLVEDFHGKDWLSRRRQNPVTCPEVRVDNTEEIAQWKIVVIVMSVNG